MSRPTVLVDLDGVLADFDKAYFDLAADLGIKMDCELGDQKHRFASKHLVDKKADRIMRRFVDSPGWFKNLHPIPGAREGFLHLATKADLWVVTKPLESNPTCRDEKALWVERHLGIEWEKRLIIAPDKSRIVGDILLDDAPKLEWIPRATWKPVVFTQPFNLVDSKWESLPHWGWNAHTDDLLHHAQKEAA